MHCSWCSKIIQSYKGARSRHQRQDATACRRRGGSQIHVHHGNSCGPTTLFRSPRRARRTLDGRRFWRLRPAKLPRRAGSNCETYDCCRMTKAMMADSSVQLTKQLIGEVRPTVTYNPSATEIIQIMHLTMISPKRDRATGTLKLWRDAALLPCLWCACLTPWRRGEMHTYLLLPRVLSASILL
jgi:hypothetical protein